MNRRKTRALFAGSIQRTVQLEELLNDITLGDAIPAGRGVRDFLDDIGLQEEIDVVAHPADGEQLHRSPPGDRYRRGSPEHLAPPVSRRQE